MIKISKMEETRKSMRKEIYKHIYTQFSKKIVNTCAINQKQVFLEVPSFVFGYPMFDRKKATKYINRQLMLSGFDVIMVNEFELYISWFKQKTKKTPKPKAAANDEDDLPSLINLRKTAAKYK